MPIYKVTIKETFERAVYVEADDLCHAEELVTEQWNDEVHVLGSDDFVKADFFGEKPIGQFYDVECQKIVSYEQLFREWEDEIKKGEYRTFPDMIKECSGKNGSLIYLPAETSFYRLSRLANAAIIFTTLSINAWKEIERVLELKHDEEIWLVQPKDEQGNLLIELTKVKGFDDEGLRPSGFERIILQWIENQVSTECLIDVLSCLK